VRAHALLVVGDKTLQISNPERLHLLRQQAFPFAMILLGTHATRDGGQNVVFTNLRGSTQEVPNHNLFDEFLYFYPHRAIVRAGRLGALQATQCLLLGKFRAISKIDFGEVLGTLVRWLLGHELPWHFNALLRRQRID
jgi:hypothetical protein